MSAGERGALEAAPSPAAPAAAETHRQNTLAALIVGGLAGGIYALGLCPTIYVGDSGELVAAAATLGIPHPSGYPLYVLLGKLWILLVPFGSVAWTMSLFSAVCAALAVSLAVLVARRLELRHEVTWFVGALVAFGPSFWSQANIQRVYALNALAMMLALWLLIRWRQSRDPERGHRVIGFLVAAAWIIGLGASNHTIMGIFGFVVGVFAVLSEPSLLRRPRHFAACVGAGIAGLLPYLYLPLRSRQQPRLDWGDPETWESFRAVVTRENFWDRAWNESPADWWPIVVDYVRGFGEELTWAGAGLMVIGLVAAARQRRRWPWLLFVGVMAANLWAIGAHGSRSDLFIWHRYTIPSYLAAAFLAGIGLQTILDRWTGTDRRRWIALGLAASVPLMLLVDGWPKFDRSQYRLAEDFGRQVLASLPPGARLAASDDSVLFVLIYLHLVEGVRPDVDLILQGIGGADLPTLRFDPDDEPLFFTHTPNWSHPQIAVEPVGLTFRTVRRDAPPQPLGHLPTALDGEYDPTVPKDYLTRNLLGHFRSMLGITFERRDWPRARAEFVAAAEHATENDVLFYNLGLIYRRNGMPRRALAAYQRSVEINPRRIATNKPARASERVIDLRPEVERLAALEAQLASDPTLIGLVEGSPQRLRALAHLLAARGETALAQGRLLLAEEVEAGRPLSFNVLDKDSAWTPPSPRRIVR
ncbi:MAG: DUF2723 domain-containing protein [Acidobacteriota bacterium]